MTLILSVLTDDYVMQVSDRYLTNPINYKLVNDEATKSIVWNYGVVFGYTGLAELPRSRLAAAERPGQPGLGRMRMNEWIAEVLAGAASLEDAILRLGGEATTEVDRLRLSAKYRGLAIIGVGWHGIPGELRPLLAEVSNFSADGRFRLRRRDPEPGEVQVDSSRRDHDAKLVERITGLVSPDPDPARVAHILVNLAREVAAVDPTVGGDLLLTCLPREEVVRANASREWRVSTSSPRLDAVTFLFVPEGQDDGINRSPTFVVGGNIFDQVDLGGKGGDLTFQLM